MCSRIFSAALLATTALTAPALADVTPADVWASWEETLTNYGDDSVEIGSVTPTGTGITVSGITISAEAPDVTFGATVEEIVFTDNGDGTVGITMSEEIPMSVEATEDGDTIEIPMILTFAGFEMTASGDPGAINTAYAGTEVAVSLGDVTEIEEDVDISFAMRMVGVSGETLWSEISDTVRGNVATLAANSILFDLAVNDATEGNVVMSMVANNMTMASEGTMPMGVSFLDPALMTDPDYSGTFVASLSGSNTELSFRDPETEGSARISSQGGSTEIVFGGDGLGYKGGAQGIDLAVTSSDLPVPVAITMGSYGYDFLMPAGATDDARPFRFGLSLVDVGIDNFLWNMFDPGEVLPRDPATIAFALDGMGRWFFDIMDPDAAMEFGEDEIPGEVDSLTLSDLTVSVAGAELTGDGAFTFDNSDLITFDGIPAPDGAVNLQLVGGNALLDKLVQMGLLPQEQAMGARMMMGLFMTPGAGDDVLTSTIAIQPNGQILANGQRIR